MPRINYLSITLTGSEYQNTQFKIFIISEFEKHKAFKNSILKDGEHFEDSGHYVQSCEILDDNIEIEYVRETPDKLISYIESHRINCDIEIDIEGCDEIVYKTYKYRSKD